jgi:hypothetical protein
MHNILIFIDICSSSFYNIYSGTSVYVRFGISPTWYVLFEREKFCLVYDFCLEYDSRARTYMSQNES